MHFFKTNLKTNTLENLHEVEKYDTLVREKDQSTTWHKRFYRDDLNRFQKLYNTFIKNFIKFFYSVFIVFSCHDNIDGFEF